MRARLLSLRLFWRVYMTNALILALAFLGLVFAPVTVSVPVDGRRAAGARGRAAGAVGGQPACCCGRRSARLRSWPRRCAGMTPCRRARGRGSSAARMSSTIARAFNEMLDRLESERRESARQALMVQERRAPADRPRTARRGRSDAHGRDAAGRRAVGDDPRGAAPAAGRVARDRPPRHRGGSQDRTPVATGGPGGTGAAERACRARHVVQRAGADPGRAAAGARAAALAGSRSWSSTASRRRR